MKWFLRIFLAIFLNFAGLQRCSSSVWDRYKLTYRPPPVSHFRNQSEPSIYIFLHAAVGIFKKKRYKGYWGFGREIMEEILVTIQKAGLMDKATGIYVSTLGNTSNVAEATRTLESFNRSSGSKIYQIIEGQNLFVAEMPTLYALQMFAISPFLQNPENTLILYVHTKGMRNNGVGSADWRRYLLYFLVERHELCLRLLLFSGYQTCGTQLNGEEYAGNMWYVVRISL
jgi:hypothetical protein